MTTSSLLALEVPLSLIICILSLLVAMACHEYKHRTGHIAWMHESTLASLLGLVAGVIVQGMTGQTIAFNQTFFFYLVLPPVIFSAGFGMKKKRFFQHLHLILYYGVLGTIMNFLLIAYGVRLYPVLLGGEVGGGMAWKECFLLAAVLCGTDEVSALSIVPIKSFPRLGALIFGEGVINDAFSIVLFETFYPLLFHVGEVQQPEEEDVSMVQVGRSLSIQLVASFCIGSAVALSLSYLLKQYSFLKRFSIYQSALVMLFGYLSYAIAEAFNLSGIMTLFVCAIVLSHYAFYSLARTAQIASKISLGAMAHIAESFAFAYIGLSLWNYLSASSASSQQQGIDLVFTVYLLGVLLTARGVTTFSLTALLPIITSNPLATRRVVVSHKQHQQEGDREVKSSVLTLSEQVAFVLGGSVRGSLCWAQVLQCVGRPQLVSATLLIVLATTVLGGVMLPMILPSLLLPPPPPAAAPTATDKTSYHSLLSDEGEEMKVSDYGTAAAGGDGGVGGGRYYYNAVDISSTRRLAAGGGLSPMSDSTISESTPLKQLYTTPGRALPRPGSTSTSASTSTATIPRADWLSRLFVHWVVFDETVMKSYFGGSLPDPRRQQLLDRLLPDHHHAGTHPPPPPTTTTAAAPSSAMSAVNDSVSLEEATSGGGGGVEDAAAWEYFSPAPAATTEGLPRHVMIEERLNREIAGYLDPRLVAAAGGGGGGEEEEEAYFSFLSDLLDGFDQQQQQQRQMTMILSHSAESLALSRSGGLTPCFDEESGRDYGEEEEEEGISRLAGSSGGQPFSPINRQSPLPRPPHR
eukprot:gene6175-6809_t